MQADRAVSLSVNFDGKGGVLTGDAGTVVRLYAPGGVNGIEPDADGYCTVTLTSGKTALSTGAVPSDAETDAETATDPARKPEKGCRSAVGFSLLLPAVLLAAIPFVRRRKEN